MDWVLWAVPAFGFVSAIQAYRQVAGCLGEEEVQAVPGKLEAGEALYKRGLPEMSKALRTLETWDGECVCLMGAV